MASTFNDRRLLQLEQSVDECIQAKKWADAEVLCKQALQIVFADPLHIGLRPKWQIKLGDIQKQLQEPAESLQEPPASLEDASGGNAQPTSTFVPTAGMVCTNCGYVGPAAIVTPGWLWLEVILYFFYLIPGIIYSIWRHNTKRTECAMCHSTSLVPPLSPVGIKHTTAAPPAAAQPASDIIDCPFCAEPIKKQAKKCKHCQSMLP